MLIDFKLQVTVFLLEIFGELALKEDLSFTDEAEFPAEGLCNQWHGFFQQGLFVQVYGPILDLSLVNLDYLLLELNPPRPNFRNNQKVPDRRNHRHPNFSKEFWYELDGFVISQIVAEALSHLLVQDLVVLPEFVQLVTDASFDMRRFSSPRLITFRAFFD